MSKLPEAQETSPRLTIRPTVGVAIGTVLGLVATAAALVIAAAYPAPNGHVIAGATGVAIGAIAVTATLATVALRRLRLPSDNDAWVFW